MEARRPPEFSGPGIIYTFNIEALTSRFRVYILLSMDILCIDISVFSNVHYFDKVEENKDLERDFLTSNV